MKKEETENARIAIVILLWLIIGCMVALVMSSCHTTKHVEQRHQESDSLALVVNGISIDRRWFEQVMNDSTWVNDYYHVTIYDTSKPIDSVTQRPPVYAEVKHQKEQGHVSTQTETLIDTSSVSVKTELNVHHQEESVENTDEEVGDRGVPRWKLWLFATIMTMCIVAAMWGKHLLQDGFWWVVNKIFK